MAKVYDAIDDRLRAWMARQRLFFVATAPSAGDGHVNCSPKGPIGSLSVLGPHRVAYLDILGSGAETIAHLRENGRVVIMLCAFEGPPRIVRLHGSGRVVLAEAPEFESLAAEAGFAAGPVPELRRAIVDVEVRRIADACGYGVPRMAYEGERPQSEAWARAQLRRRGPDALRTYRAAKNERSIDGLPAVDLPWAAP